MQGSFPCTWFQGESAAFATLSALVFSCFSPLLPTIGRVARERRDFDPRRAWLACGVRIGPGRPSPSLIHIFCLLSLATLLPMVYHASRRIASRRIALVGDNFYFLSMRHATMSLVLRTTYFVRHISLL
jgi:hypothetical protein